MVAKGAKTYLKACQMELKVAKTTSNGGPSSKIIYMYIYTYTCTHDDHVGSEPAR